MTITLAPEIERALNEQLQQLGTTPEGFVTEAVREKLASLPPKKDDGRGMDRPAPRTSRACWCLPLRRGCQPGELIRGSPVVAYLIETNILMRLANPNDALHSVAGGAIVTLRSRGEALRTAPQNLIEFRNGATRPAM